MSLQTKIVIIVIIAVAILGGAYLFFFNGSSDTSASAVGPDTSGQATVAETKFIDLSAKAQSITFDTSIFSDPRFTALVDTRTSVVPVPTGRPDPFAPFSGESTQ